MKIRNILLPLCVLVLLLSCSRDDTTLGTGMISEISIDVNSMKDVYDIDKNEVLRIVPKVSQLMDGKPLTYTWEIDQKVYSQDPELVFVGNELGSFRCRLIVENEDGKAFYPFSLNVNSPYEEGLAVISCDENGKSMLSFMMKQRTENIEEHFYEGDCFALNNPDFDFIDNVVDVMLCDKNLLLMCKGNDAGQPAAIYYLNNKTFVLENYVYVPEYSDFRPFKFLMPANSTAGTLYPIICENGKIYDFSPTEGAVELSRRYKSTYSLCAMVYDSGSVVYNNVYTWDNKLNGLSMLYNCYGPYLCSSTYLVDMVKTPEEELKEKNYFNGYELVFMFLPRVVGQTSMYGQDLYVVTKKGALYQKTHLSATFWYTNEETGQPDLAYKDTRMAGLSTGLTATSPYVATAKYGYLLYGQGNKVMRWIYEGSQMLNAVTASFEVGTPNAVITSMELSQDHEETFVAFYEPDEEGLNGHVWVFNTEKGELLRKYDNICNRPVKVIYKRR